MALDEDEIEDLEAAGSDADFDEEESGDSDDSPTTAE